MSKADDTADFFTKGGNCAQSVLKVYGGPFGLTHETALKIGSALGGGIARTGGTCGLVTGAVILIGLKYGPADVMDKVSKKKTYDHAGRFMEAFRKQNGSTLCRELLGFDISDRTQKGKKDIISKRCPNFTKVAAGILEDILNT